MKNLKKTIAFILAAVLTFSLFPAAGVMADEDETFFIESDDTATEEQPSGEDALFEDAAAEEFQIPAFDEGDDPSEDPEEERWSIGIESIDTYDYEETYNDFEDFNNTIFVGEGLYIYPTVHKNDEDFNCIHYEEVYYEDEDEYFWHATGYEEGCRMEFSLIPKQEGAPEIEVEDHWGYCGFQVNTAGDYTFKIEFFHEDEMVCSLERDLTVTPDPDLPTDYRVAFELNDVYYDALTGAEIDTYYMDVDSYVSVDTVLYVEGKKALHEYESEEGPYFRSKWIDSSNEDVISITDYGSWSNESIKGEGETVLTAGIYYAPDHTKEPKLLTAATLKVVVSQYEIKTKENLYNKVTMYVVGEEAVIKPEVYTDVYDDNIGEWGEWVVTPEDPADIVFDYDITNLSSEQYVISEDTHTLTIPSVPEGQHNITITASRNGSVLVQTTIFAVGSYMPESLGLLIRSLDNTKDTVYTFHNGSAGYVDATAVGFEWGETHFEFLDPKTKKPISGMEEHKISGGFSPSCMLSPVKTGDVLIRATLYREIDGSVVATEDKVLHVKSPTVTVKDQTYTGKALKPAPTVKIGSKTLKKDTDYTVKYSNNTKVGTATVTITGKNAYKGTLKKTFKINPKATTISKLTAGSKKITVKWKKQASQTSGYEIQCSLKKDFKKIAAKKTVSGASKTSGVLSKLTKGKKYYVRIRTYKKIGSTKYYSAWKIYSKTVKVK